MIVNGVDYQIIGGIEIEELGCCVPVLDIPMMPDERWLELTNTPEQIERRRKRALEMAGGLDG